MKKTEKKAEIDVILSRNETGRDRLNVKDKKRKRKREKKRKENRE